MSKQSIVSERAAATEQVLAERLAQMPPMLMPEG